MPCQHLRQGETVAAKLCAFRLETGEFAGRMSTVRLSIRWGGTGSNSVSWSRVRQAFSLPQSAIFSVGSLLSIRVSAKVSQRPASTVKSEAALKGTASNGYVWIGIVAIEAAPCNGFKTHHQRFQSHPLRYSRAHDIKKTRGASYVACNISQGSNPDA